MDHHVREHHQQLLVGEKPKADYLLPLTGAQVSQNPHYRLLGPMSQDAPCTGEELKAEAAVWRGEFAEDYRLNIAVGQMHEHKDTCFKCPVCNAACCPLRANCNRAMCVAMCSCR